MTRILVTGGAGFIGSHLVDRLIELGHRVTVVDNLSTGRISNLNGHAKFYEMNVEDKRLESVFELEKPEIVFHMAAQISVADSFRDTVNDGQKNIIASLNLLENCRKYNVKKIIFSSSAAVYGDVEVLPVKEETPTRPNSPYGISKLTTESYIELFHKKHGLNFVILRYANAFGPRQMPEGEAGVIPTFMNTLLQGGQVKITGDGSQTRDFIYVKDLVEANVLSMEDKVFGVYNVSSNTQTSIKELFYIIKNIINSQNGPQFISNGETGIIHSRLCNEKICRDLSFVVRHSLQDALNETINYYKSMELNKNVWLVMAAYNEGERIGKVLKALNAITENIVVVNDCSKDNTSEVASQYKCHIVDHPINFGQGAALQAGMDYAVAHGAEVVVHFDGDGQMQIKDIPAMVDPILKGEVDITLGSRFLGQKDNVPFTKKYFIHKPAIYLNWLLTGMKMSDAHCGFRALSKEAVKKCTFRQNRMAHATEILNLVRRSGLRYKEVPVDILYHVYGQSFMKGFKIIKDLTIEKTLGR